MKDGKWDILWGMEIFYVMILVLVSWVCMTENFLFIDFSSAVY